MGPQAGSAPRAVVNPTSTSEGSAGARRAVRRRPAVRTIGRSARYGVVTLALATLAGTAAAAPPTAVAAGDDAAAGVVFDWQTVVNNGVTAPGDTRPFNSYNQPSLNLDGLVVFRGRTKGGLSGEPTHGVFTRDMAGAGGVLTVFDRSTAVPQPDNLGSTFIEPPSFPRIDLWSDTIASRGNHSPVWTYLLPDGTETRGGTTGIYTTPFGSLVTGASNLGGVPDFSFLAVPGTDPAVKFDVFPGSPSVTDRATIVFKGNFTDASGAQTGVYYRDLTDAPIVLADGTTELAPAGGMGRVVRIADTGTRIPGSRATFGSTAPPSAAGRTAVFAGFDNEASPSTGGIYLAQLTGADPKLKALVTIGQPVPGEKGARFSRIGEGLSFDGRFVGFWGAWGSETTTLVLQCPAEGNKDRQAYCRQTYPDGFTTTVPVHQGIFVFDTADQNLYAVAKTPNDFTDLVYWNFSGRVPGSGEGSEGDTGEPARWRSASFVAVSGLVDGSLRDVNFHVAFKARQGEVQDGAYVDPLDGIYLRKGPSGKAPIATVVQTGMDGSLIDPQAPVDTTGAAPVTEMGLERDGFRGVTLAVNVRMGAEESATGWAGIYLTRVPGLLE